MDFDFFDGCGDDGFELGWFFPAMIVGKVVADAMDRSFKPPQPPPAPPVHPPHAPTAFSPAQTQCPQCKRVIASGYAYCPHCGDHAKTVECGYCGQTIKATLLHCGHCGAPIRQKRTT